MPSATQWVVSALNPAPPPVQRPSSDAIRDKNLGTTWRGLLFWLTIGLFAMGGYAWSAHPAAGVVVVASSALLLATASASVGILFGFLFGIPRSLQDGPATGQTADSTTSISRQTRLRVNTNLEQISDWLTKILVGVGLTNLKEIGPRLWRLAGSVAPAIGGSAPVALAVVVNFTIWGFFVGYLLTRLFLASAFSIADDAAERLSSQEEKAFDLTQKRAYTSAANQYLNARDQITPDTPPAQRQRIYEGLVYTLLYVPPPDGYLQAQKYALEYINDSVNPPSARVWTYLAAAYGQEYTDRRERGENAAELKPVRDKALDAVKEALRLEPRLKSLLRSLWDPADPTKASKEEDDLEVFRDDEEFKRLLE